MKWLILTRHAKSSWKQPLPDLQRPLNKRGRRNAPLMAERLADHLAGAGRSADLLISSPAERAMSTARVFAAQLQTGDHDICVDADLYHADHGQMLEQVCAFDDTLNTVVWFGHNPELTLLVELLSDADIDNVPTCGICCIEFPVDAWSAIGAGSGRLEWFDYPKRPLDDPASGAGAWR